MNTQPTPQLIKDSEVARILGIARKSVKDFVQPIKISKKRTRYRLMDVLRVIYPGESDEKLLEISKEVYK